MWSCPDNTFSFSLYDKIMDLFLLVGGPRATHFFTTFMKCPIKAIDEGERERIHRVMGPLNDIIRTREAFDTQELFEFSFSLPLRPYVISFPEWKGAGWNVREREEREERERERERGGALQPKKKATFLLISSDADQRWSASLASRTGPSC